MRIALLLALVASAASAQTAWRPALDGPSVSADVLFGVGGDIQYALYDDLDGSLTSRDVSVTSSAVVLSARIPVRRGLAVTAEVPMGYVNYGSSPFGDVLERLSDGSIGNMSVGLEADLRPDLRVGAMVRVPLFNDFDDLESFGWQGGLGADAERFEAYVPDVVTIGTSATFTRAVTPSARLRARLAPTLFSDVSGAENAFGTNETSLAVGYAVQGEIDVQAVTLNAGVFGRPFVAGDRFEILETTATLGVGAALEVGGVRPGLSVRVPLDGDRVFFDPAATVGFSLDVALR